MTLFTGRNPSSGLNMTSLGDSFGAFVTFARNIPLLRPLTHFYATFGLPGPIPGFPGTILVILGLPGPDSGHSWAPRWSQEAPRWSRRLPGGPEAGQEVSQRCPEAGPEVSQRCPEAGPGCPETVVERAQAVLRRWLSGPGLYYPALPCPVYPGLCTPSYPALPCCTRPCTGQHMLPYCTPV